MKEVVEEENGEKEDAHWNEGCVELCRCRILVLLASDLVRVRRCASHRANPPTTPDGKKSHAKSEQTVVVSRNGGEEEKVSRFVQTERRGTVLNERKLNCDPCRDKGDARDGRTCGIDKVGKGSAGDAETIGDVACDSADH